MSNLFDLQQTVLSLEERVEDQEAYESRDTIVLSGSELPAASTSENATNVVCDLIRSKIGIVINPSEVSTAHRLGKKANSQAPDTRNIIVKFCRRDTKLDLQSACRRVKPKNLFINENLTPIRNSCLYGLRQAKKIFPSIVAGCGSMEGKVYAWVKPPNPNTPMARNTKVMINSVRKFDDFCSKVLKCESKSIVSKWPNY